MSDISSIDQILANSQVQNTTGTKATSTPSNPGGELGKDDFLKLLIAQLRYQNPLDPTDPTQFMAQTAQFTMVEKLTQMADQSDKAAVTQKLLTASSMVGKQITYLRTDGTTGKGIVTSAVLADDGGTSLKVGTDDVPIEFVKEIDQPSTP